MKSKEWNDEECAQLRKFWLEDGLSMTQIAANMGRTRNSIGSKIARLGMVGLGDRMIGQRFPGDGKPRRFSSPLSFPD